MADIKVIMELWEQIGQQSAGASELTMIQQALRMRGVVESPASIARTLADHGVPMEHPGVMEADLRWRQDHMTALFSTEELELGTLEAANSLIEKIERLRREFESDKWMLENLRQSVRQMRSELELVAAREKVLKKRELAEEFGQWLMVWLQNPQIFEDWLALRRSTVEFKERFGA